jgi:hypothetical protein
MKNDFFMGIACLLYKTEIRQNREGMGVCKDLRKQLPL